MSTGQKRVKEWNAKRSIYLHGRPLSLSSVLVSPLVAAGCTGGGIPMVPNKSPKLSCGGGADTVTEDIVEQYRSPDW